MTIAQKLNPTNRYSTLKGPTVPCGYKVNKVDEHELEKVLQEALTCDTTETNPISNQSKNSTTG